MPTNGYRPPRRLFLDSDGCVVRVVAERDGRARDFDFASLPLDRDLQVALAHAFHTHTGPSGTLKALGSANSLWVHLNAFARILAALPNPPQGPADLKPSHLNEYLMRRASLADVHNEVSQLMTLLAHAEGLSPALAARCAQGHPKRRDSGGKSRDSYTPDEERRILEAARHTVRNAAERIRGNHDLLRRWRDGERGLTSEPMRKEYFEVIDGVERAAELPRYGNGKVPDWVSKRHGRVDELMHTVHLAWREVAAFAVLLVRLTGHNGDTIYNAPAAHHRPDGGAGPIASVQLDLVKPRRGRRSYMTAALSDLPTWATPPRPDIEVSPRDELHTPYGVYMLALELTASARRITGSDKLFVFWGSTGAHVGRGFREGAPAASNFAATWGRELNLPADPAGPDPDRPLAVRLGRMRKTYLAREQKPIAHTTRTLADTYLRRDRTTLEEYQQLVAEVLTKETDKARAVGTIAQLTAADLAEAGRHPGVVAARFGVTEETLRLLVARDADTVLTACSDNLHSPHSTEGQPCKASFLKCLDCPCARALPQHLPIQAAARDLLQHKQNEMTALRWAQRLAYPFHQLEDLLDKAGAAAVQNARQQVTDTDRALVARLLNRELDHQ